MRILLLTQLFQPEPNHLKGLVFAKELVKLGHSVQVLTGFPNYPGGKVYDGYTIRWRQREVIDGVDVIRVVHYASHDTSGMKRFANYISFALSAATIGLALIRRPDVIHVYQGPATLMIPAFVFKTLLGAPIILDVQDIWPESVTSSKMLKIRGGEMLLRHFCNLTYRVSDRIIVLSTGYKNLLSSRGVDPRKIKRIYNWCDESSLSTIPPNDAVGIQHGLKNKFNIIFAGTMGKVQALDTILDCAAELKDEKPDVQFVFVGGGVEVPRLMAVARDRQLANVRFIPRQPSSTISQIFAYADVLLIHLRSDELGKVGIPQKTQAYLAAGKPILMAVDGEAAEIIKDAAAGVICLPENASNITCAIRKMFLMSSKERAGMGENGRRYYYDRMGFEKGVKDINTIYFSTVHVVINN